MDILVIGSTGTLGTRLRQMLREGGHDVVGVARNGQIFIPGTRQ